MRATDGNDQAVSSVVGTVLMLAITVSVFGGFSVVVLGYLDADEEPPLSEIAVLQDEGSLYFLHKGGEGFPVDGAFHVNRRGYDVEIPLDDPRLAHLDGSWDLGDLVCVQGDAAGCLYGSHEDIRGAAYVGHGALLAAVGEAGQAGTPPSYPDLVVELVGTVPTEVASGMSAQWTVRITNLGTVPTDGSDLLVAVAVDGSQVALATASGVLGPGGSVEATSLPAWTATLGPHTLTLAVDPAETVLEESDRNNEATSSFDVAVGVTDPGDPFIDVDGDGLYGPGDTILDATEVQDGSFAASGDLVLPPSIGPITSATVDFDVTGDLVINTDITATSGSLELTGGDITIGDGAQVTSAGSMVLIPDGTFNGDGAVFVANGPLQLGSSSPGQLGTVVNLRGATIDNTGGAGDVSIQWQDGDLDATGVTILTNGNVEVGGANSGVTTGDVLLDGATIDTTGGTGYVRMRYIGGTLSMAGAVVDTKGAITLSAGTGLVLTGADLDNTQGSGAATLSTAAGALQCDPCTLAINGQATLSAASLDLDDSASSWSTITVTGAGNDLALTATGGGIAATYGRFTVTDQMTATLPTSPSPPGNWKMTVTGAVFDDANDTLDITNTSGGVASWYQGTPATGYAIA